MHATLLILAAGSSLLMVLPRAGGQSTSAKDPVVVAARSRQEAVKTLSVEFRLTEKDSPGAVSARQLPSSKPKGLVPAQETTLTSTDKLVFDGNKVRYENNHPSWLMPDGKLLQRSYVCTFNGEFVKHFFPKGVSGDGRVMTGVIERHAAFDKLKSPDLTPLMICFRGLMRGAPYLADKWRPTGASLPIDKATCREYIRESGSETDNFWVDPNKGYIVRRYTKRRNGQLAERCDITYRSNEVCGWVPESWVRNEFDAAGAVTITNKVKILSLQINAPQPKETFEIVFPPGCYVYDNRSVKEYRVQADGSMRELSPSGKELSTVVPQPGTPWYQRHQWLLASLGAILAVAVLAILVRRGRRTA